MKRIKNKEFDCSDWGITVSDQDEHMMIGKNDCVFLAKEYGTPLTLVNQEKLKNNYLDFSNPLKKYPPSARIYFSYKTNPVPGVIDVLHQLGAGAEVVSEHELWLALKLGVAPQDIVFNGPIKSDDSLKTAIESGVGIINVNSFEEISRFIKIVKNLNRKQKVGVRVTLEHGWQGQLGLNINNGDALRAYQQLTQCSNFDVCGMHFHLGTKIDNTTIYEKSIAEAICFSKDLRNELECQISILNIGGGFGVPTVRDYGRMETKIAHLFKRPYLPCNRKYHPSNTDFVDSIIASISKTCDQIGMARPMLMLEPGRAISSNAQMLLLGIEYTKTTGLKFDLAIADGGRNVAPLVPWEYHELFVANKMRVASDQPLKKYRIIGSSCNQGDILYDYKILPHLEKGDVLAIMDTGAYFISNMTTFSYPRPPVVMVTDGPSRLIRKRESFDNLVECDDLNEKASC